MSHCKTPVLSSFKNSYFNCVKKHMASITPTHCSLLSSPIYVKGNKYHRHSLIFQNGLEGNAVEILPCSCLCVSSNCEIWLSSQLEHQDAKISRFAFWYCWMFPVISLFCQHTIVLLCMVWSFKIILVLVFLFVWCLFLF